MCSLISILNIFNLKRCILKFIKNMKYQLYCDILTRIILLFRDNLTSMYHKWPFLVEMQPYLVRKRFFKSDPKVRFSKYEDLWSSWGLKIQIFQWVRVIMICKFFLQSKIVRKFFLWFFYFKIWLPSPDIRIDVLKIYS